MSIDEKTGDLYNTFQKEMALKGYTFEALEPQNQQYTAGLRLRYAIPQDVAMKPQQCNMRATDESVPITQVAVGINRKFLKHMMDFYEVARATIKKLGKQPNVTEPMFARDGRQVIYVGMK